MMFRINETGELKRIAITYRKTNCDLFLDLFVNSNPNFFKNHNELIYRSSIFPISLTEYTDIKEWWKKTVDNWNNGLDENGYENVYYKHNPDIWTFCEYNEGKYSEVK